MSKEPIELFIIPDEVIAALSYEAVKLSRANMPRYSSSFKSPLGIGISINGVNNYIQVDLGKDLIDIVKPTTYGFTSLIQCFRTILPEFNELQLEELEYMILQKKNWNYMVDLIELRYPNCPDQYYFDTMEFYFKEMTKVQVSDILEILYVLLGTENIIKTRVVNLGDYPNCYHYITTFSIPDNLEIYVPEGFETTKDMILHPYLRHGNFNGKIVRTGDWVKPYFVMTDKSYISTISNYKNIEVDLISRITDSHLLVDKFERANVILHTMVTKLNSIVTMSRVP